MFSPKCVPNDPLGTADALASDAEIVSAMTVVLRKF